MNARQDKRFILTFSALLYIKIMQNSGSQRGDLTGILVLKEKTLVALATLLVAISSHALFFHHHFACRLEGSSDRFRRLDISVGEKEMRIAELEAK